MLLRELFVATVDATDSRIVTFSVVSVESFTYEVMVGDSVGDGDHTFSGAGGDDTITVEGGTTTPARHDTSRYYDAGRC